MPTNGLVNTEPYNWWQSDSHDPNIFGPQSIHWNLCAAEDLELALGGALGT